MVSLPSLLTFIHLTGLAVGVGAATVKLVLLFKCKSKYILLPFFLEISKPVTRLIITGLILLTLSGIGWILLGQVITPKLVVKIILVAAIWIIGPIIDNVIEPRLHKFTPTTGQQESPEFVAVLDNYLVLEIIATGLFYLVIFVWVLG